MRARHGWLYLAPALVTLGALSVWPIGHTLWLSLHRSVLPLPWLGEPFVGLENYRRLIADPATRDALATTLAFVASSTALEIALGLAFALVVNEAFRGRSLLRAVLLLPWALPTVVSSQMWRLLLNDQYGLINALLFGGDVFSYRAWLADPATARACIVAADVWKTTPFVAIVLLAGLQAIPTELYEAAEVDGAGRWQRFRRVTLPLLVPALVVALLFRMIDAFRVFDLVFVLTQGGPADGTLVLQYYGYKRMFVEGQMGLGAAVAVLVFAMVAAMAAVTLRVAGVRSRREAAP
jgi:ABC-type sugar transport system permease subunit